MSEPDRYVDWDAAYVLGALSPQERRDFESHKADCARCAAAVEELAGMPGILASVARSDAERATVGVQRPEPVPAAVLSSLLGRARRRQLRRRVAGSVLAAAAVIALAVGVTASTQHRDKPAAIALAQLVASPVHADVTFASESWGTRIDLTCTYQGDAAGSKPEAAAEAHGYVLVMTDRLGHQSVVASWRPVSSGKVTPSASVAVPLKDIAQVQIRSSSGTPLLQLNR